MIVDVDYEFSASIKFFVIYLLCLYNFYISLYFIHKKNKFAERKINDDENL